MGRDDDNLSDDLQEDIFQSTLPAWGETYFILLLRFFFVISIHSPRMGRDHHTSYAAGYVSRISIHSPRMGRDDLLFAQLRTGRISIHSPRMGRD